MKLELNRLLSRKQLYIVISLLMMIAVCDILINYYRLTPMTRGIYDNFKKFLPPAHLVSFSVFSEYSILSVVTMFFIPISVGLVYGDSLAEDYQNGYFKILFTKISFKKYVYYKLIFSSIMIFFLVLFFYLFNFVVSMLFYPLSYGTIPIEYLDHIKNSTSFMFTFIYNNGYIGVLVLFLTNSIYMTIFAIIPIIISIIHSNRVMVIIESFLVYMLIQLIVSSIGLREYSIIYSLNLMIQSDINKLIISYMTHMTIGIFVLTYLIKIKRDQL